MNVEYWMSRADRALATAAIVAADGDPNGACSNAYYAMFYASRAALLKVGQAELAMGKTHSGMVSAFNQYWFILDCSIECTPIRWASS